VKAIQNLGQILEIAEIREGANVEGERFGVAIVKPEGGGIETFLVGFSGASDASEIENQFESQERIVDPGQVEAVDQLGGRRVGDDVEEEVEAGIAGGEEGGGEVFSEKHRRWLDGEGVGLRHESVHGIFLGHEVAGGEQRRWAQKLHCRGCEDYRMTVRNKNGCVR